MLYYRAIIPIIAEKIHNFSIFFVTFLVLVRYHDRINNVSEREKIR